ncbi:hypothetical protein [Tellurirhabdus rosea]|uniref:hypothetical protein n=1 Tax=Tellurirhabdus rosea TaxID=2674997 RepID=UPI00225278F9|nr:hypothetical protein [Tellurirhabdus rosea]
MAQQLILEEELASLFSEKALIQLPQNYRLALVRYGPLVASILFPIALVAVLAGSGSTGFLSLTLNLEGSLGTLLLILSLLTGISALPGLFYRRRSSWSRLYWAGLLYSLSAIVTMDFGGLLLTFAVGFYLLFQIRSYYNK